MSDCRECRPLFVDAYYKELPSGKQEWMQAHLKTCAQCAAEYRKLISTLEMMSERQQEDPGQEFWDGYYARLQERIGQKAGASVRIQKRRTWIYRVAAAIAFISIGLIIGKFYFGGKTTAPIASVAPASRTPQMEIRTARFLERSQVLLLGLVNTDVDATGPSELMRQKQISHDLVHEASLLKTELKDPRQRKLQQLVSELQIILIQIANLKEEGDLQGVELVKGGVDRKGILLKINLEQMRMTDESFQRALKPKL